MVYPCHRVPLLLCDLMACTLFSCTFSPCTLCVVYRFHRNNTTQLGRSKFRVGHGVKQTKKQSTSTARSFPSRVMTMGGRLTAIFSCTRLTPAAPSYLRRASPDHKVERGFHRVRWEPVTLCVTRERDIVRPLETSAHDV